MAQSETVGLVGGSLVALGGGFLVVALASLGGGLYEVMLRAGVELSADASCIVQAVLPPHLLRSLKQDLEKLRQSLEEFSHTLLEVQEVLEAGAESEAQAEEGGTSDGVAKGAPAILSMADVCRELGMSKSWVYNRVRSGQIPSIKVGGAIKIKRADLNEYIEKQPYYRPSFEED